MVSKLGTQWLLACRSRAGPQHTDLSGVATSGDAARTRAYAAATCVPVAFLKMTVYSSGLNEE